MFGLNIIKPYNPIIKVSAAKESDSAAFNKCSAAIAPLKSDTVAFSGRGIDVTRYNKLLRELQSTSEDAICSLEDAVKEFEVFNISNEMKANYILACAYKGYKADVVINKKALLSLKRKMLEIQAIPDLAEGIKKCVDSKHKLFDSKKVLFISSEGGHFSELLQLTKAMNKYNSFIVTEKNFLSDELKANYGTRINFLLNTKPKKPSCIILAPINILYSLYYFIKINPDVIITTGAHTAVAMCYIAKLSGKKIIYIETFANLESKTMTGRLVHPIADVFVVQWESMLKLYPDAIYLGGVY